MQKTLSLETSEILEPYIKHMDTKYLYIIDTKENVELIKDKDFVWKKVNYIIESYKTLTLEEAFDILPDYSHFFRNKHKDWVIVNPNLYWIEENIFWKTKIECVECFLVYLLDNDLLW